MMKRSVLIICITLMAWSACDTYEVVPELEQRLGYDFFPLQTGDFRIYSVQTVDYKVSGEVINDNYELMTVVSDSFINQGGELSYIINRFSRQEPTADWQPLDTWNARTTTYQAIMNEENIPFVKLSFPIAAGKTWNGNNLNALEEEIYTMDSLYSPYITGHQDTIPATVTVVHIDNQDFAIEQHRRYEIYGRNIGLVYREDVNLKYCTDDYCFGQEIIVEGREYHQTLKAYGKN